MKKINNGLGDRLRELRYMYGTQQQFEDVTGCNRMVMSRYIDGITEPQFTSLVRICIGLGVDANWLVLGDETRRPDFLRS